MIESNLNPTYKNTINFREIFQWLAIPFLIINEEGQIIEANQCAETTLGYGAEELRGTEFCRVIRNFPFKVESFKTGRNTFVAGNGECQAIRKTGKLIPMQYTSNLFTGSNGERLNCITLTDISEQKREKQKEFEKRHEEALINSSNDQIWSLNPQFELLAANKSFIELLKKETGITYKKGDNLMHLHPYTGNFLQLWKSDFDRAVAGEHILEIKYIPETENLKERWVEIKCNPIFENDKVIGIVCYSRNITERKIADELLKESETNLAKAQSLAKLGNWHRDLRTGKLTWSKELYHIAGIDINSPIDNKAGMEKYIDEKDRQMVRETGETVRKTGDAYTMTYHVTTPKGDKKIIKENGYGVKDANRKVISLFGTAQDITESKLAEEAIKNALYEKETILESIGDAFFAVDNNWMVTYWNKKAGVLLGKTKEEMTGKNLWSIFNDFTDSKSFFKYHLALRKNEAIHFEDYYEPLNQWFEIGAYPSNNGLSVYFKDITPRKIADETLRITNERYNLVAQATNDSIWDLDIASGFITRTGGGFKLLFGYENEFGNDIKYIWGHLIHPDDIERVKESEVFAFNNPDESYWEEEYRFLKADGQYAYVNDRGFIIRDNKAKAIRFIGATQDITRQKEHVKQVTKIQQNLDALINTTSDIIWSLDTDLKIITANKAFKNNLLLLTKHEVKEGEHLPGGISDSQLEHWNHLYERAFSGERFTSEEKLVLDNETDPGYFLVTFSPIKNKDNKVVGIACFGKDITELKRAANLLKKSEKRFAELFHLSPQPMWLYESDSYCFAEVNKAMMEHYGYSQEELLQMTIMDIRPANDITRTKEIIQKRRWKNENAYHEKFAHIKKSGEIIDVQVYSNPIVVNNKNYTMVIAIDITEKIQHEQKITKAIIKAQENERYEISGELHDNVCQLLATSKMSLGILKKDISPKNLHILEQSKEYITLALDEIRNISHRLAPTVFNDKTMEEAFEKLLRNFNVGGKYHIAAHFDEAVKNKTISIELQLNLYRILQEQLRNILKYADATVIEVDVISIMNNLKMRIADNGKGFNTYTSSDGIGLGNMKRRTELFNGKFEITSSPGNGCEIVITIPAES